MNIAPTIEGGLRIDAETDEDWHVLRSIIRDACGSEIDLATRLGQGVSEAELAEDWQELVVPDLRESFADDLHHVAAAIESAAAFSHSPQCTPVWITPEDAFAWYGALNQARLAIEENHRFSADPDLDPETLGPVRQEAYFRNAFYGALQTFILQHVLAR